MTSILTSLEQIGEQIIDQEKDFANEISSVVNTAQAVEDLIQKEVTNGPIDLIKLQKDVDSIAQSLSVLSDIAVEAKADSSKALGVLFIIIGGIIFLNSNEKLFSISGFILGGVGLGLIVK